MILDRFKNVKEQNVKFSIIWDPLLFRFDWSFFYVPICHWLWETASGMFGVRIPAATYQRRKKQVVTAPILNARNRWECHGSLKMTVINRCPLSHHVRHPKEPSMFNGVSSKFQPFTGNGDVSIWFKNSRVG